MCAVRPAPRAKPEPPPAALRAQQRDGFRDVTCLLLSYKNVIKIDNLYGFEKLVKLQIDNNIIGAHALSRTGRAKQRCTRGALRAASRTASTARGDAFRF